MTEYAENNIDDTSQFMCLERCLTNDAPVEIAMQQKSLRKAILKEQDRQTCNSFHNPGAMSIVSQKSQNGQENELKLLMCFILIDESRKHELTKVDAQVSFTNNRR